MHTWLKTIISLSLSSPPLLFSVSSLSLNASIIHGISRLYPHRRTNLHPEEHLWLTVNCSFSSSLWYGIGMMTIMRTTSRWNKKSIIKVVVVEMLKIIIMMIIMIMYLMIFDGEEENKKKKPSLIRRYKIAILLHYLATVR